MASKKNLTRFDGGTKPVYVINPDLSREYQILVASGIYPLTHQPEGARKITLKPIQRLYRCGNPMMMTFVTLGIVPIDLPGGQVFQYDLESDGIGIHYYHRLPTYDRISIWEWLVRHNEEKILAEALAWSSPREQLDASGISK